MLLNKEIYSTIKNEDILMSLVVLKQLANGGSLLTVTEKYIQGKKTVGYGLKRFVQLAMLNIQKDKVAAQKEYKEFLAKLTKRHSWQKILKADPEALRTYIEELFDS